MKTAITFLSRFNQLMVLFTVVSISAAAQVETRRINVESFKDHVRFHSDFQAKKITLPPVDVAKLMKEDEKEVGLPPRFGKALEVDIRLAGWFLAGEFPGKDMEIENSFSRRFFH